MKFPNDFHRHPKVTRLPVEVRWAFVEMNGEARIADNDGVFDAADAEFMWGSETIAALLNSHPTRPLLVRSGETLVIREYAKHQQTRSDREALSQKRSDAARKRWGEQSKPDASAVQVHSASMQPHAESESELETDLLLTESVTLGSNRARSSTDSEEFTRTNALAQNLGIDLQWIAEHAEKLDRHLTWEHALGLGALILSKSKRHLSNPMGYVVTTFRNNSHEVQQWIDTEVMT